MPNNPLNITAEDRKDYLYVSVVSATTTRAKMLDWLSELSLLSAETRKLSILLDRDIPEYVMDEALGTAFKRVCNSRKGIRLAVVNRFPVVGKNMKRALSRLGKLTPNVQFFDHLDEAEKWLMER
jgi:hypothetical protein